MSKVEKKIKALTLPQKIDLAGRTYKEAKLLDASYKTQRGDITIQIEKDVGRDRVVTGEEYNAKLSCAKERSISVMDLLKKIKTPALLEKFLSVNLTKCEEELQPDVFKQLVKEGTAEKPTLRIQQNKQSEDK